MHISINTDEGLSDLDKSILRVLAGDAPAAPAAAAPAKKAAAAPAKKAAAPEPAEDAADDSSDDSTDAGTTTLEEAVALATKMVSNGEAAKVKAALGTVGAKKVSEIPEDKVDEFVAALS